MNIKVRRYHASEDYENLMNLIKSEGEEWKEYLNPKYQIALEQSVTYVAYADKHLCGYSRSYNDFDFQIFIVDLLVDENYRGYSIGKKLMECILMDFPNIEVFVLSDVDKYYEKIGYKKEGSIFQVKRNVVDLSRKEN